MPIERCQLDNKPGFRWGKKGKCYTYTEGNKSSETQARNRARDQGIATGEYRLEILERLRNLYKNKFASLKVSFDFDGTLTRDDISSKALELVQSGMTVYILTAHSVNDKRPVLEKAKELGIPESRVIFVENTEDKVSKAIELGIAEHFDDNKEVVDQFNEAGLKGNLV